MAASACFDSPTLAIGVAMGGSESQAARQAWAEHPPAARYDTLFHLSNNNLAAPAIEAAQQLVAVPGMIAVIGHANSAASLAAATIYNDARVVQLSPNTTAELYSRAGDFSFRLAQSDDAQARFLAEVIAERFVGRRTALLYVNDDYGRGLRRALLDALPDSAVRVVADLPHLEDGDSAAVRRGMIVLADAQPELIIWLGRALQAQRWLPAVRATLGSVPVLASDGLSGLIALAGWADIGPEVMFVDLVDPDRSEALRAFRADYRQRYGAEPIGSQILTYDAVRLLDAAVTDGARTGEAVRAWLHSLGRSRAPFEGVSGPIAFDDNGDVVRPHVLCTMRERLVCR
ncbi:MAG: ABC transporter substrate-binding protein [Longimicrobiales bacterium]